MYSLYKENKPYGMNPIDGVSLELDETARTSQA